MQEEWVSLIKTFSNCLECKNKFRAHRKRNPPMFIHRKQIDIHSLLKSTLRRIGNSLVTDYINVTILCTKPFTTLCQKSLHNMRGCWLWSCRVCMCVLARPTTQTCSLVAAYWCHSEITGTQNRMMALPNLANNSWNTLTWRTDKQTLKCLKAFYDLFMHHISLWNTNLGSHSNHLVVVKNVCVCASERNNYGLAKKISFVKNFSTTS